MLQWNPQKSISVSNAIVFNIYDKMKCFLSSTLAY